MPTFEVTAPDGRKFRVTAPEGATKEQALERVKAQMGQESAISRRRARVAAETPEAVPLAPDPMARVGRGMMDVVQGAKQKYLNWTNPAAANEYTREVASEIERYQQGRQADGQGGVDWLRIAGSAAPFAVLPAGGSGLIARTVAGAAGSGLAGYSIFDEENDPAGNLIRGGISAASGGLLNAAAPAVVRGVTQGAQSLKNAAMGAMRRVTGPSDDAVRASLRQAGINLTAIPDDIQARVLADAREQLLATGELTPEQLLRRADIESVAGPGSATRGQLTRDPAAWTQERNLQRTEVNLPAVQRGEAASLTARYQGQGQARDRFAGQLSDDISGVPEATRPRTPLQASEQAIEVIRKQDEAAEDVVRALYREYEKAGVNAAVPDVRIADELGRVADEVGVENIPPAVLNRLKEFGFAGAERTKLLTVREADKLNRLINNNNPGFGPQSLALGRIKRAVNESLLDIPDAGDSAVPALFKAREAAAERFAAQRAGRGVEQAIADVPPDRFFERNVLGGAVRDLQKLRETLVKTPEGTTTWNNLRAQAWQSVIDDATSQGRKALDGTRLDRALNKIGEDRLRVLFPDELPRIEQLRRASVAMTTEPDLTGVNYSNTTPALVGALSRGNKIPGLSVITDPIERSMQEDATLRALSSALQGQGANTMARDAAQQKLRNELARALTSRQAAGGLVPAYIGEQDSVR